MPRKWHESGGAAGYCPRVQMVTSYTSTGIVDEENLLHTIRPKASTLTTYSVRKKCLLAALLPTAKTSNIRMTPYRATCCLSAWMA